MDASRNETKSRTLTAPAWLTTTRTLGTLAVAACLQFSMSGAEARLGTARPPAPRASVAPVASTPVTVPAPPPVATPFVARTTHGFEIIGFIQHATVETLSSNTLCPGLTNLPASQLGGTAVMNGLTITIPCNMIVQMPAATFSWADLFVPTSTFPQLLTLDGGSADGSKQAFSLPSTEIRIAGNVVGGKYIAGLIYVSQQSLNLGKGYITGFDYASGVVFVGRDPKGANEVRLQLNDPNGRFSKGQSPDARFSVDDQNPTIKSASGYPMCVPRADPTKSTVPNGETDPLCPQRNRPKTAQGCRNFALAGVFLPTGRDFQPPVTGQVYCSAFVMPDPAKALPAEPTSKEQAPFQVGDFINYMGTVLKGSADGPADATGKKTDTISVHTIEAQAGIFTQPGTLPVYLAIGQFGVGADPALFGNTGAPQEALDRLFLEANVTDVTSIVDIYMVDHDPVTGKESQRWITPANMTGEFGAVGSNGQLIDGGITTQFAGPQPGRARIRATRATPGILISPTRYVRVVARSLCDPANINGIAPLLGSDPSANAQCLQRAPAANGLFTGQYLAPNFGFIFPENVVAGDPVVANSLWVLGFLSNGEGPGTGPLMPTPW